MAIRPIVLFPDQHLRTVCSTVSNINEEILQLLDDLAETMRASNGIGLAAPQVGISQRIFVVDVGNGLFEFINPEILDSEGTELGADGCLSIPGIGGETYRSARIRMRAQNRNGEWFELGAEDLFARCIQHEYDHLNGVLFIDKAIRLYEDQEEGEAGAEANQPNATEKQYTIQDIKLHHADFLNTRIRNSIVEDLDMQAQALQSLLEAHPAQLKFTFDNQWVMPRADLEQDLLHLKKISQMHVQKKLKKQRKK
ncbi:peptide deformylase [Fodinisporobacter ferrooxydans]|uniref:peptide deformylase n=1 Tax=Fodinisporobacter ferrooxydans TaxID=2901836 RepID=UPI003242A2F7